MASQRASLPPGPKGLPLLGNMPLMPTSNEWIVFKEWGAKYGEIMSVTLARRPVVIVNSARLMLEQLNGEKYGDRPRVEFGGEQVGYSKTLVLLPASPRFREYRKYVHAVIGTARIVEDNLSALQQYEVHRFIKALLRDPNDLVHLLRKMSGSIILKLTYSIHSDDEIDNLVTLIEKANDNFNVATTPGAFLVDQFPSMNLLPSWFPGGRFKKLLPTFRAAFDAMVDEPYNHSKSIIRDHPPTLPSCVSKALERFDNQPTLEQEFNIKHAAASLYGGGADTTVASQHAFVLAMVLNPDVQKKAQQEIDSVTHGMRLPTLADRAYMPYIQSIVLETVRWHSVAPLGVAHRVMEDGFVSGQYEDDRTYEYSIPKDSTLIFNLWAMLHDEKMYPEPFKFIPERHLGDIRSRQYDPRKICFGTTSRRCPGSHLAEASIFLFIAMTLAVFDILPATDSNGQPIYPVHENTPGTISHPKPFPYSIQPRSPQALELINSEAIAP